MKSHRTGASPLPLVRAGRFPSLSCWCWCPGSGKQEGHRPLQHPPRLGEQPLPDGRGGVCSQTLPKHRNLRRLKSLMSVAWHSHTACTHPPVSFKSATGYLVPGTVWVPWKHCRAVLVKNNSKGKSLQVSADTTAAALATECTSAAASPAVLDVVGPQLAESTAGGPVDTEGHLEPCLNHCGSLVEIALPSTPGRVSLITDSG